MWYSETLLKLKSCVNKQMKKGLIIYYQSLFWYLSNNANFLIKMFNRWFEIALFNDKRCFNGFCRITTDHYLKTTFFNNICAVWMKIT